MANFDANFARRRQEHDRRRREFDERFDREIREFDEDFANIGKEEEKEETEENQ